MTNEFIRTIDKARTTAVDAAKALPQQIRDRKIDLPKVEVSAFGRTLVSMPKRTIDLTSIELPSIELPKSSAFNDRLGQVKVLAPIDVDALVARFNEVGDYLQTLPARLGEVPSWIQGIVSDFPESATKLVEETTTKAKSLVDDLKTRPILFVPARKPAAKKAAKATRKPAAKKATKTAAKTAAKTTTANGSANGSSTG